MSNCDYCANYVYDEETDMYICDIDLDEDETEKYLTGSFDACPYFRDGDEYKTVRRQN